MQENNDIRNNLLANCDICGKELSKKANFCTNCGHPYRVDVPQANFWAVLITLFTIIVLIFGSFICITEVMTRDTLMGIYSLLCLGLFGIYSFSFVSILNMLETIQSNTRHR